MAANQSGKFRNKIHWRYNSLGMRSSSEIASCAGVTLLVGDSVVDGGNKIDQSATLAELTKEFSGHEVYPIACHGWSLYNQMKALTALPDWDKAKEIFWLINSGDLDTVGMGESELSFPTRRPVLLAPWLLQRHIYRTDPWWWPLKRLTTSDPELARWISKKIVEDFLRIATLYQGKITIIFYPKKGEDISHNKIFKSIEASHASKVIYLTDKEEWSNSNYQDDIHPNMLGTRILAQVVAAQISCNDKLEKQGAMNPS